MPRKRKLADLGERCRFCLARDACMTALFANKQLAQQLKDVQSCTDVEITNRTNYPKNVCHACLYKLQMWSEFKSQFLKTNKTLNNHFKLFEQNENNSMVNDVNTADETLLSDDNSRKRVKIGELSPQLPNLHFPKKPIVQLTDITPYIKKKTTDVPKSTEIIKQTPQEFQQANDDDKNNVSTSQLSLSDSPSRSGKPRARKVEREASTKRWVERKNALIVATGERLSDSESENEMPMSPVQKAREEKKHKKKIDRELKYLQTNLTEKYCVKQEVVMGEERKTRSRRTLVEQRNVTVAKEEPKSDMKGKKEVLKVEKMGNNKEDPLEDPLNVEVDEPREEIAMKDKQNKKRKVEKENIETVKDKRMTENEEMEQEEMDEAAEEEKEETSRHKFDEELHYDEDVPEDMIELLNKNVDILEKKNGLFTPQLVTSEVSIGNATYIVTTTLDMPNPTNPSGDNSLKTNGMNTDATSQDSKKVDIMKLEGNGEKKSSPKRNAGGDGQKCLKIEIEGMEVEALQRVQLDLAHFINEDIRKRLMEEAEGNRDPAAKPSKFKDSYENLNYQLRNIIEKVLRTNYSEEIPTSNNFKKIAPNAAIGNAPKSPAAAMQLKKAESLSSSFKESPVAQIKTEPSSSNFKKLAAASAKGVESSPTFQPKVKVAQLEAGETGKMTNYNDLQEAKRKTIMSSLLNRTAGKRRPVMPKKYLDYSVEMGTVPDEERKPGGGKSTPNRVTTLTPLAKTNHSSVSTLEKNSDSNSSVGSVLKTKESVLSDVVKEVKEEALKKALKDASKQIEQITKESYTIVMSESATSAKAMPTQGDVKTEPTVMSSLSMTLVKSTTTQDVKFPFTKKLVNAPESPSFSPVTKTPIAKRPNDDGTASLVTPKRERHICGMCGKELFSTNEANLHMEQHRTEMSNRSPASALVSPGSANVTASSPASSLANSNNNNSIVGNSSGGNSTLQKPKPKLMRCKRCQAIVEAKHVKTHVCNSVKYNCDMCECTFGAQHLLIEHRQTHSQPKNKLKPGMTSSAAATPSTPSVPVTKLLKPNPAKSNQIKEKARVQINAQENNEQKKREKKLEPKVQKQPAKEAESEENTDDLDVDDDAESRGVACFVCDRVFSNEQQMKDHLQMHCEEVSESIEKDNFTCAFCANKFPNEEQLEAHVNVHLNEDGDEKISMMIDAQIEPRRDRQRKPYRCQRCGESFPTTILLAIHNEEHADEEDEEAAAAEAEEAAAAAAAAQEDELAQLENQEEASGDFVCEICDEIFDTQAELGSHREVHNGSTHVCILCEMPFVSIEQLQEHVSTHL